MATLILDVTSQKMIIGILPPSAPQCFGGFWGGRVATLEEQVLKPIQDSNEMDMSLSEAAARVSLAPKETSRALASYIRSILYGDPPTTVINRDCTAPYVHDGGRLPRFSG